MTSIPWRKVPGGVLLGTFLIGRLVILARSEIFEAFDSSSYEPVSLTGHAPRPWGVPVLYAILGSSEAKVVGQWVIGTLAWTALGIVLWALMSHLATKAVAGVAVAALGLASPVASWDFAILSESLSVSLLVGSVAAVLWWMASKANWALAVATALIFWLIFTRLDMGIVVAALALTIVWHARKGWAAAAVVLAGLFWILATVPATNSTYQRWGATGLPQAEETFLYRLRLEILPNPQTSAWYHEKLALPSCPEAERIAGGQPWAIEEFAEAYKACPALVSWAHHNMTNSAYAFALSEPLLYIRNLEAAPMLSGSGYGAAYAKPVHVLPVSVERALFQPRAVVLPLLLVGLIATAFAAFRIGAWSSHRALIKLAAMSAIASAASIVITLMYSAGEYSRLGTQEAVLIRISLVLMALAVLDTLMSRRSSSVSVAVKQRAESRITQDSRI